MSQRQTDSRSGRQDRLRQLTLQAIGRLYRGPVSAGAPRSLLLIRPDHLGDVLLLTPALHALREALPDARITLLVGPWNAAVLRDNQDADAVLTTSFPGFERRPRRSLLAPYQALRTEARRLRSLNFDAAVVLRFDHWWGAWLAAQAGVPRRIGYDLPAVKPFLTECLAYTPGRHETRQNATLLAALAPGIETRLGPARFNINAADRAWAEQWLRGHPVAPDARLVAIHPGAGAAVKQWPPEHWATVGNALITNQQVQLVLTGGPAEQHLTAAVAAKLPAAHVRDAAGLTTLGQLAALYERCTLVLGADSGPLHLAVAVGARTLHLYGPVPAAKFGPWGDPDRQVVLQSDWICAPCDRLDWPPAALSFHGCVTTIEPDRVLRAAVSLLEGD